MRCSAFSLDGIQPSNTVYSTVTNALFRMINLFAPKANIPYVDLEQFRGSTSSSLVQILLRKPETHRAPSSRKG